MQKHRILSLASILLMLIIPVGGWFLVGQPQIAAAAAADEQRVSVEQQIQASAAVVAQLEKDSANMPALNAELDELRASIPAATDPSGYIDGLDALARINDVTITGLTVADATAYAPPVSIVAPAPAEETTEGEAGTDPAVAPPVADPAVVTNPLIDSTNFVAIPVSLQVKGQWSQILKFVNGLQTGDRLFLVTALDTTENDEKGSSLTATIAGYIYAIPTGVEGDPRPTSTIVKSMDPPEDESDDGSDSDPDPDSTDSPDPDPTETSEP